MDRILVVGLGNPGSRYRETRHNLGFKVCDRLRELYNLGPWKKQNKSKVTSGNAGGLIVHLAKPQTYMNLSGQAVLSLMTSHRFYPHQILVVYDDLALPFGRIRLRPRGSDGGHNGMADVLRIMGKNHIPRLRIGIGQPPPGVDPAWFVLSPFSEEERQELPRIISLSAQAVECFINEGIDTAMNLFNTGSSTAVVDEND